MGKRSNKKKKKKNNTSTGEGITTIVTTITSSSSSLPPPPPHYPLFHISSCSNEDHDDDDWLVFEILNRLPVKTLTRFKSVCKRWYYLIEKDQQFIDLHLTRSKTRLPSRLLIVVRLPRTQKQAEALELLRYESYHEFWPYKEFHLTADLLLFQEEDAITKLKLVVDTVREIDSDSYNVITKPVNGLVCLIDSFVKRVVRIRNISTGQVSPWFESSSMIVTGEECVEGFPNFFAFGFDPATNEHKLVCVLTVYSGPLDSESFVCGVLTIGRECNNNNNRWRRIDEIPPYELNDGHVHVNGVIYWSNWSLIHSGCIPRRPVCLVAFDLGSEKFRTITIPDFILDRGPRVLDDHVMFTDTIQLFEVDGDLAMVVKLNNCTFNMYIYEDDYYKDGDEKFNGRSTSSPKNGRWSEVSCITFPFYMMNSRNDVKFHTFVGSDDKILVTSSTLGMEIHLSIYCYNWKKDTWTEVDVSGISSSLPQLILSRHCFSTTFSESLISTS